MQKPVIKMQVYNTSSSISPESSKNEIELEPVLQAEAQNSKIRVDKMEITAKKRHFL